MDKFKLQPLTERTIKNGQGLGLTLINWRKGKRWTRVGINSLTERKIKDGQVLGLTL